MVAIFLCMLPVFLLLSSSGFSLLFILWIVAGLAYILANLILTINRLHDLNYSAWLIASFAALFFILNIIGIKNGFTGESIEPKTGYVYFSMFISIGFNIVMASLYLIRGTMGKNKFGEAPFITPDDDIFTWENIVGLKFLANFPKQIKKRYLTSKGRINRKEYFENIALVVIASYAIMWFFQLLFLTFTSLAQMPIIFNSFFVLEFILFIAFIICPNIQRAHV